jgi:PKHD-type hydroxylase
MYQFAPAINKNHNVGFTYINSVFTDTELEKIIDYAKKLETNLAEISPVPSVINQDVRRTQVSWIHPNDETIWFYDRMASVTQGLNSDFYNFDLYGFRESIQFAIYEGGLKSHYDWHIDGGTTLGSPRKLSLVLQLSDPSDYEGGELQIQAGSGISLVPKEKGLIVAFPSYTLHRVTPVTEGIRYSIVVWACGPAFK